MKKFTYTVNSEDKTVVFKFSSNHPNMEVQFSQKRSAYVFKKLLESYPKKMNIHSLDKNPDTEEGYNDPNKALSVLRVNDGFEQFIDQTTINRVIHAKINLKKFFKMYLGKKVVNLGFIRKSPSKDVINSIIKNNKGMICNISGFKLYEKVKPNSFMGRLRKIEWDHRIPLSKGGNDSKSNPKNWQMLSSYVNKEKNKICQSCENPECKKCALAFPEKNGIIFPTGDKITDIIP